MRKPATKKCDGLRTDHAHVPRRLPRPHLVRVAVVVPWVVTQRRATRLLLDKALAATRAPPGSVLKREAREGDIRSAFDTDKYLELGHHCLQSDGLTHLTIGVAWCVVNVAVGAECPLADRADRLPPHILDVPAPLRGRANCTRPEHCGGGMRTREGRGVDADGRSLSALSARLMHQISPARLRHLDKRRVGAHDRTAWLGPWRGALRVDKLCAGRQARAANWRGDELEAVVRHVGTVKKRRRLCLPHPRPCCAPAVDEEMAVLRIRRRRCSHEVHSSCVLLDRDPSGDARSAVNSDIPIGPPSHASVRLS
eukprot:scaffold232403_cov28-Tisochrysis_lutea.AAC.2